MIHTCTLENGIQRLGTKIKDLLNIRSIQLKIYFSASVQIFHLLALVRKRFCTFKVKRRICRCSLADSARSEIGISFSHNL